MLNSLLLVGSVDGVGGAEVRAIIQVGIPTNLRKITTAGSK